MRGNDLSGRHDDTLGWLAEDFVDIPSEEFDEDDPWSASSDVDVADDLDDHLPSLSQDERVQEGKALESEQTAPALPDEDISELLDLELVDAVEPLSSEPDEDLFADIDEPEPYAIYDGELSESLHVPDADDGDTSQQLSVNQFISEIADATQAEQAQISELLENMSRARLRRMLSWLKEQDWTGNTLLLFLEFRLEHWEENQHWWDYTFWNSQIGHWWTYSSPYILSMDATYLIVQSRSNCSPDGVVEESWLNDWNELALWRRGFSSFAAFALFRAGIREGEDWWELMRFYASDSQIDEQDTMIPYDTSRSGYSDSVLASLDGKYRVREDETTPRRADGTLQWFAVQDWYDPSEWHDGLGWALSWAGGINPYMLDEALDSMRGLI